MRVERIGNATLYLGDCREVLPTVPKTDAIISDPPYSSGGFQGKSSGSIGTRSDETILLDNLSTRGYQRLMREVLGHLAACDEAYIFTDWRMWTLTSDALEDAGFPVRNMLVWDKKQIGMGKPWRNQHELIAFAKRTPSDRGGRGNVLQFTRSGNKNHPTEKPVDLMECLLSNSPAQSVVDPFMGSGTTGVAAAKMGREFHGIEADPKHFETACRRIEAAQAQGELLAA